MSEILQFKAKAFLLIAMHDILTVTSNSVALCNGQHWMRFKKACFASSMFMPTSDWWCIATCSVCTFTRILGGRQCAITCECVV